MFLQKDQYKVEDLRLIMELLRSEQGCPWDREQTHQSIRNNFIEEVYEACEAIDLDDTEMLREELGDVLLQVVFHSQMSREQGGFDLDDVADRICKKLILRHPHIFGDIKVANSEQVLNNWDEIKKKEKGHDTVTETMKAVPKVFPALLRSAKVQKRAAKSGFDYPDVFMALDDLESELKELRAAIDLNDQLNMQEELGDLLFSCVNVARFLKVDPEDALAKSCEKFIRRFEVVEELAASDHIDMKTQSIDQLNELWYRAKKLKSN